MLLTSFNKVRHKFQLQVSIDGLKYTSPTQLSEEFYFLIKIVRGAHVCEFKSLPPKKGRIRFPKHGEVIPLTMYYDQGSQSYQPKPAEIKAYIYNEYQNRQKIASIDMAQYIGSQSFKLEVQITDQCKVTILMHLLQKNDIKAVTQNSSKDSNPKKQGHINKQHQSDKSHQSVIPHKQEIEINPTYQRMHEDTVDQEYNGKIFQQNQANEESLNLKLYIAERKISEQNEEIKLLRKNQQGLQQALQKLIEEKEDHNKHNTYIQQVQFYRNTLVEKEIELSKKDTLVRQLRRRGEEQDHLIVKYRQRISELIASVQIQKYKTMQLMHELLEYGNCQLIQAMEHIMTSNQ